ncbi:addiction module protein [Azospirillum sp. A39]|uniref:addiction module protein n=1 Tax=Azospirillum sp. A39 TaxID=3462279 RepID=UPI004045691E
MTVLDFSHLTPRQRLALISELWDSLETGDVPLTPAQAAEIDRRVATLDEDIKHGQDASTIYDELTARYR